MARRSGSRNLLLQSVLWIAAPLGLMLAAAIVIGALVYRQVVFSLLVDRDRQLAALSAAQIGRVLSDQALVLQTALETDWFRLGPRPGALDLDPEIAERFSAGVVVTDPSGVPLAARPPGWQPGDRPIHELAPFQSAMVADEPVFSDVIYDSARGERMVLLAVGLRNPEDRFAGVALAGMLLDDLPIGDTIRGLSESDEEFAYLVDANGQAIFHPDPQMLGRDLGERPFVRQVIAGETGGMIWTSPAGERLVQGFAPVPGTSWGLIVREPWEVVVQPARLTGAGLALVALIMLGTSGLLIFGARRITRPIAHLAAQIPRLASGERFRPASASGVEEIDLLSRSFEQMAEQVESYRAGLRRYLKDVTASQEDERRRIARELHDDTIQNLLAIQRTLELQQMRAADPEQLQVLRRLQEMVEETARGVREISRDLRPMILEDLGLIPALRALLQPRPDEPPLEAELRLEGTPAPLGAEQELALYRTTQEALSNVRKHASAASAVVRLAFHADRVALAIEDDGAGFDPPASLAQLAQQGCFGLMGIQERAWAIGGELEIESSPGKGTRLRVSIPFRG